MYFKEVTVLVKEVYFKAVINSYEYLVPYKSDVLCLY